RKAYLLEDKQIPSVRVFDEVFLALGWHLEEIYVTWAHLEKKWTRLRTYTNYLEENPNNGWRRCCNFLRQRQKIQGDGFRILTMASERSRPKETLEDSR
ncbi:hypothetical protein Tco_0493878, partial [Tanacetum coccineum]